MKIRLSPEAYLQYKYYVLGCEEEISGLGESEKISEDEILVKKLYLFNQVVSPASSDLDKKELSLFLEDLNKRGIDTSNYNVWWHSHAKMDSYFSSIDDDVIDDMPSNNYLVSLVSNHKLEIKGRVDIYKPFRLTIDEKDTEIVTFGPDNFALKKRIDKEIKKKVTQDVPWEDTKDKKTTFAEDLQDEIDYGDNDTPPIDWDEKDYKAPRIEIIAGKRCYYSKDHSAWRYWNETEKCAISLDHKTVDKHFKSKSKKLESRGRKRLGFLL